jgi:hypothetical protein
VNHGGGIYKSGIVKEHLLPGLAAVFRAIHPAFGVRGVQLADRRHEEHVGVLGIDRDLPDVLRRVEAQMRPGLPRVIGAVDAVAEPDRVAQRGFAAAHVDDVRR